MAIRDCEAITKKRRVDYTPVDLSDTYIGNPSSVGEALDAAQTWILWNEPDKLDTWDAILVRDDRSFSNPSGRAPLGAPTALNGGENFAAGSSSTECVAYCTNSFSSHLEAHEVGHMYGGNHDRHARYGWWEHTVMGNSGQPTCAGTTSDGRTRTDVWNGCVYSDIHTYMDYWHDEEGAF